MAEILETEDEMEDEGGLRRSTFYRLQSTVYSLRKPETNQETESPGF